MRAMQITWNRELEDIGVVFPVAREVEVETYKDYYRLIGCELFDVVNIEFKGEPLSIFIDDEGLFKRNNLGIKLKNYDVTLFGNMVVMGGVDSEGETLPLPESIDNKEIMELFILNTVYVTNE